MGYDQAKIVQLMPANGWKVFYKEADGTLLSNPVLALALWSDGEVTFLDTDRVGIIEFDVTAVDNFSHVVHKESC